MIVIKQAAYEAMLAHARSLMGEMSCGLVGGRLESGKRLVESFHPVSNTLHSLERFSPDRSEQSRVYTRLNGSGAAVVGTWFCHPNGDAAMTAYEIRAAHDRDGSYLVLSLADPERPVLRSYRVWGGRADEETLCLEP